MGEKRCRAKDQFPDVLSGFFNSKKKKKSDEAQERRSGRMDVQRLTPSVVQILQEVTRGAKEEKDKGTHIPKSDQVGTVLHPIVINPLQNPKRGTRASPITVEEEVEIVGEKKQNRGNQGSNQNNPIFVEVYNGGKNLTDDVLLQIAVEASLCQFEGNPLDPKQKKPKNLFPFKLKLEVGQCSKSSPSAPPLEPEEYCSICMEPKLKVECFAIKNCSHLYCTSCVSQYVEAKIEENVTSIGCPDPGCKDGVLELEMCRFVLKPEVFDRWGRALCETMIVGAMKFYCPFKDCSALLINDGEEIDGKPIRESECPHCFRLFCVKCKVPWHSGVTCEDFAKLGADERGREDLMLRQMAKKSKWQRCPKCKYYVERTSGCMFIKCRCGHKFCYGCATEMTIDHYCRKCKR